ncbi:MAG: hypothetical protein JNN12_14745 [Bacteroidetes Order II. Incertae sedis bacterium]|nr:hypothetical protein [Bacteroidetes Order II. bacterium]
MNHYRFLAITLAFGCLYMFFATEILAQKSKPGQFDYYLLALSWSPTYCAEKGQNDPQQCGIGKQLGFVLHGLWPQNTKGWPQNCTQEALKDRTLALFPDLFPSEKLARHEWKKHGTCSGLSQQGYLNLSKKLKDGLRIPAAYQRPSQPFRTTTDALKQAFVRENTTLKADGLAPICSGGGRFFQELRVCFNKNGFPTGCSDEVLRVSKRSCGQPDFLVRSVR